MIINVYKQGYTKGFSEGERDRLIQNYTLLYTLHAHCIFPHISHLIFDVTHTRVFYHTVLTHSLKWLNYKMEDINSTRSLP